MWFSRLREHLEGPESCQPDAHAVPIIKLCVFITAYSVCVFTTAGPITKLFAWGEGDSGGHVLRETTSRGLCGLVCASRTAERGGEGDFVKEDY
jgi:hypothetical protein